MKNLGKYTPQSPGVLVEGINLTKEEFEKVGKIFHKLENKYGITFSKKSEIIDAFKSEMRQKFSVNIGFEDVQLRNPDEPCSIELIACRFQKNRPLVFLVLDLESNSWAIIDEKRFPPLDEKSPFLPVKNI